MSVLCVNIRSGSGGGSSSSIIGMDIVSGQIIVPESMFQPCSGFLKLCDEQRNKLGARHSVCGITN
jgi:hypothetical protein